MVQNQCSNLACGTLCKVFSWGNGANYQLGTGATGLALAPTRVEGLHATGIVALAAGKFHSAALAADGTLCTWGFGRGGRLGKAAGCCYEMVLSLPANQAAQSKWAVLFVHRR